MEKPDSIKKFDLFYLAAVVLSLVNFGINYNLIVDQVHRQTAEAGAELGGSVVIGSIIFATLVSLLLWFMISKKRVEFIKWVLILFLIWSFITLPGQLADGISFNEALGMLIGLLQAVAIWFLFRPDAKEWFAAK